jgi:RNA recognition motif-containing protein
MSQVLYIRHLPSLVTERKLERLFSRYGTVLNAEIIANPDSKKLGHFGVVTMDTEEGARAAVTALNHSAFFGGALSVRCATNRLDAMSRQTGGRDDDPVHAG